MFKRLINHCKRWNRWRKGCFNSWWHKLLVLLRLRYSPTFELTFTEDEITKLEGTFALFEKELNKAYINGENRLQQHIEQLVLKEEGLHDGKT